MIDLNAIDRKLKAEQAKNSTGVQKTGNAAFEKELSKIGLLEDAFNIFNEASESLKEHYGLLERRVAELDRDLADKSVALEENLKKSSRLERYQANILRCLPSAVIVFDRDGVITSFNRRAEEISCFSQSEAKGENIGNIMGGDILPLNPIEAELEGEFAFVNRKGNSLQLRVLRTPLRDDFGGVEGVIVILHDITREKMLEDSLARGKRLAAMGEMAAKLAHEIRNPLGGIELFASNLKKHLGENPRAAGMLDNISSAVSSLNHLVTNTLQFARMKSPDIRPVDAGQIVDEALMLAIHLVDRHGIVLLKDYSGFEGQVHCDREMMKQVFLNVIMNAAQAMSTGGKLDISLRKGSGDMLQIEFRDNGPGMPDSVRAKIFDPFYSTKESGSGLGLAIVHNIMSAHKGSVKIESREGEGTSVTVNLPLNLQKALG